MAQPVSYITFDVQLIDDYTGVALSAPGGEFFVCTAGGAVLQAIYDPDNNYAVATNPKPLLNGRMRFAIQNPGGGQPYPPVVDVYGMTATGRFFVRQGQTPGAVPNLFIDQNERDFTMVVPWSLGAAVAGVEYNTGIVVPAGTLIAPEAAVQVQVAGAASSIKWGTLSTQAGGNSGGFINGVSIAAVGMVKATINGASPTLGALLQVISAASTVDVPEWYPVPAADVALSYTLLAGTPSGSGFIIQPYTLPN